MLLKMNNDLSIDNINFLNFIEEIEKNNESGNGESKATFGRTESHEQQEKK